MGLAVGVAKLSGVGLLGNVRGLYRLAIERAKPNAERAGGYQDRDLPGIEGNTRQLDRRYDPKMEKQLLAYWFAEYVKLPADQRIAAVDAWLSGRRAPGRPGPRR